MTYSINELKSLSHHHTSPHLHLPTHTLPMAAIPTMYHPLLPMGAPIHYSCHADILPYASTTLLSPFLLPLGCYLYFCYLCYPCWLHCGRRFRCRFLHLLCCYFCCLHCLIAYAIYCLDLYLWASTCIYRTILSFLQTKTIFRIQRCAPGLSRMHVSELDTQSGVG